MSALENCSESATTSQSQHTQAIMLMAQAMQSQTATLETMTAAIMEQTAVQKELAQSNRTLAKAMLDMPDDEDNSETYLDGTPKL